MADAAIVIGINKYWEEKACLRGAVADALDMRTWLVAPGGAAVPEENVFLLLAPLDDEKANITVPYVEATADNILTTILVELEKKTGLAGKRFYFYFSGHGVNARVNFADVSTLLATNFSKVLTQNSLSYSSIFEWFKATQFEEQFFFLDACRNTPWADEFVTGQITKPKKLDPLKPPVQQYTCYATTPGLQANELQDPGDEHGAFTGALVEALGGAAKVWDARTEEYVVRWQNVFGHVRDAVEARRLAAEKTGRRIQVPQSSGDNFMRNPILCRISTDQVTSSKLRIEAAGASSPVEVEVVDDGDFEETRQTDASGVVELELKPRDYTVRATSSTLRSEPRRTPVSLYGAAVTLPVKMVERPVGGVMSGTKGFESFMAPEVTVRTSDPVARVELVNRAGEVVAVGLGLIDRAPVDRGMYTARLRSPEGVEHEELFYADGERTLELTAKAPPSSPTAKALIGEAGFAVRDDNTLDIADVDAHAASTQLSTLLTLAAQAINKDVPWGSQLYKLGLRSAGSFLGGRPGVQVLVGSEHADPAVPAARIAASQIGVFAQGAAPGGAEPLSAFPQVLGLGAFVQAVEPGPCWVRIGLGGRAPFDLATVVLPERLTLVVVHETAAGQLHVYQYLPTLKPLESFEPTMMRSVELAQRAMQLGDLEAAAEYLSPIAGGGCDDPLITVMRAYIALRRGDLDGTRAALAEHAERYTHPLPDWHLLRTELGEPPASPPPPGLPLVADGLRRLDGPGIPDPVPGFLWSVCDPQRTGA